MIIIIAVYWPQKKTVLKESDLCITQNSDSIAELLTIENFFIVVHNGEMSMELFLSTFGRGILFVFRRRFGARWFRGLSLSRHRWSWAG